MDMMEPTTGKGSHFYLQTGKRPRSPSDQKLSLGKENKRQDKTTTPQRSRMKLRNILTTNDSQSSPANELDADDARPSSPSKYDVRGSPTPSAKLQSHLKRVLLYENVMEQRLLDQEMRKLDAQKHRGAVSMATDIARVRESSARLKRMARTQRTSSADAIRSASSNLPPIVMASNKPTAAYIQQREVAPSPTAILRQRMVRQKARSAGTFLPKISRDTEAKAEAKSNAAKLAADLSLPHVAVNSKYGTMTTRSNGNPESDGDQGLHSAVTEKCLNDDRFKKLQESLLAMSTVRDMEKRWTSKTEPTQPGREAQPVIEEEDDYLSDWDESSEKDEDYESDYIHPNTPVSRCSVKINEL